MQNHAECEAIVRRLWPFLDGALPENEKARIIAHLERCTNCSSHFAFAQAFLEAVREAKPPTDEYAALRLRVMGALSAASLSGPTT